MTLKNNFDMKPDKLYFGFCEATHLESYCLEKKGECQTEYLRKDALIAILQGYSHPLTKLVMQEIIDKINSL